MSYKVKKMLKAIVKLLIIALLTVAFIVINHRIDLLRLKEIRDMGDSGDYAYQVDAVSKDKSHFIIDGWFFRLEEVRKVTKGYDHDAEFGVLLEKLDPKTGNAMYDDGSMVGEVVEDTDEKVTGLKRLFSELTNKSGKKLHGILSSTEISMRNDVNDYFACGYDYSKCGFKASFELSDLDLENGLYRVVFKTDMSKKESVPANAYIYKGELSYTNPVQSQSLDVVGTDLEKIVNNGVCLVSRPDYHCDIYQYGWKLYWIVDDEFYFKENGSTPLEYMMGTTQFDRLPAYRTDNDWYWGNVGSTFEAYEITDTMNCGKYRVSVRDIPNGYSITYLSLGYYEDGKWIWNNLVRPYYDFTAIPDPAVYGYLGDDVADWMKQ